MDKFYKEIILALAGVLFALSINKAQAQVSGLRFLLYTKSNPIIAQELKSNDLNTINSSNFAINKTVKFLAHGYTANYQQEFPQDLKNVYVGLSETYNVIAVDWAQLAKAPYTTAAPNAKVVGREIAKLINLLVSNQKTTLGNIHFIGHSLGAQVGSFISSNLSPGGKISRATGLDPALPGFENVPISERLDATDADFVDVIRTSCGISCTSSTPVPPIGTVDFYPNGGVNQPGCAVIDSLTSGLCSHTRSYKFYTESVTTTKGFKSYKCTSYANYQSGCSKTQSALMGELVSRSVTGMYYLTTNAASPYAQG